MEGTEYKLINPNNIIRTQAKTIFNEAKKYAACNGIEICDSFMMVLKALKNSNYNIYKMVLQIMYTDYEVNRALEDEDDEFVIDEVEEDEEEYDMPSEEDEYKLIDDDEDLIIFADNNKHTLTDMASSISIREIDLAHTYESIYSLKEENRQRILRVNPFFIYDLMEVKYPFIIDKLHKNMEENDFTVESSAKNIAIVDLLNEMKKFELADYGNVLLYYLEIYYKFKKFCIEKYDSTITQKERELIKLLDNGDLTSALDLLSNNDDLIEIVINEYTSNFFKKNEIKEEVDKYYLNYKRREKIDNIFRKNKNK